MTDADEVLAATERRSAALIAKDVDALLDLLHPDFVYVNASGEVLGRDEYLNRYVRSNAVQWSRQEIAEPRVAAGGGAALVTYLVRDVATFEGEDFDETFRSTLTWVRDGEAWRCLGGHTSHPPA